MSERGHTPPSEARPVHARNVRVTIGGVDMAGPSPSAVWSREVAVTVPIVLSWRWRLRLALYSLAARIRATREP